jgi:hypothetical protein
MSLKFLISMAAALPVDLKCVQISGDDRDRDDRTEIVAHIRPVPNRCSTATAGDRFPELMFHDSFSWCDDEVKRRSVRIWRDGGAGAGAALAETP